MQWSWPQILGEDKFIVMLHIEMAVWNSIADFLDCSGWTAALCEAEVATLTRLRPHILREPDKSQHWYLEDKLG